MLKRSASCISCRSGWSSQWKAWQPSFDTRYGVKEQKKYIKSVADDWGQAGVREDRDESVRLLNDYASNGHASEGLLRAFLRPAENKFGVSFEQLIEIFEDQELLFKIEQDIETQYVSKELHMHQEAKYIVPIRLSDSPPPGFKEEVGLSGTMRACELKGTFGCGFLPPGFTQRLIAAMHRFGRYHRHFGLGGIVMESEGGESGPRRIFFFDLMKSEVHLRVQQSGVDEEQFMTSLVAIVDEMRRIVEIVTTNWKGLGLSFAEEVRVKITHDITTSSRNWKQSDNNSMNLQVHNVLSSNEAILREKQEIVSEINAQRSKAMERRGNNLEMIKMPEQREIQNKYTSYAHLKNVAKKGGVRLVSGDWLVETWKKDAVLPCRQEAPEEAFVNPDDLNQDKVAIFAVSYPWITPQHPDPKGFHLAIIAEVVEMFMSWRKNKWQYFGTGFMLSKLL